MSIKRKIADWIVPEWHPDFGDPKSEFILLQNFAVQLSVNLPELNSELDAFEEGYMCVVITNNTVKIAELFVTDIQTKTLCLYVFDDSGKDRDELLFQEYAQGIEFLSKFSV